MPFGQHQDTKLWNHWINQFPETRILGLPVSRRIRGLVCVASRYKTDVDTFHKGIQYLLEKLRKSKFRFRKEQQYQILIAKDTRALGTSLLIIPELRVLVLTKRHVGSSNEIDTYPDIFESSTFSFRIRKFPDPHIAYSNRIRLSTSGFTVVPRAPLQ